MSLFLMVMFVLMGEMPDGVVAVVGNKQITTDEYIIRYKAFLERTGAKDNLVARKNVLQVMVYEEAVIQNAVSAGVHKEEAYRRIVEKSRIRNLLGAYYDLLADTMTVSDAELQETFRRMNTMVRARHLYAPTLSEAEKLRDRIRKGEQFSRLALQTFSDSRLKYSGGDLGYFRGGEMERSFEDAIFSLPIGSVSDPVRTEDGYSIIKVEERVTRPLITEQEYAQKKHRLEMVVKEGRRPELAASAARSTAVNLAVTFEEKTIGRLMEVWKNGNGPDQLTLSEQFAAIRNMPLAASSAGGWSISDLSRRMFKVTERQYRRVRTQDDLKNLVTGLMVQEELLRRAEGLKLDSTAAVRSRMANDSAVLLINAWSDRLYRRRLQYDPAADRFLDPKTERRFDDSVKARYRRERMKYVVPEMRTVAEIVVDSMVTAMSVVRKFNAGTPFDQLAKKYSLSPTAADGGRIGHGPVSSFGTRGELFFSMRPKSVSTPVHGEGNYTVYCVTDVRPSRQKSFADARPEIAGEVLKEWRSKAEREELESILPSAGISIDQEKIATLSL